MNPLIIKCHSLFYKVTDIGTIVFFFANNHWKSTVVMKSTFSSMVAAVVVITTTPSATNDKKVVIMVNLGYKCLVILHTSGNRPPKQSMPFVPQSMCKLILYCSSTIGYRFPITLIPAWISNCIHYTAWDEITYPFQRLHRCSLGMDK